MGDIDLASPMAKTSLDVAFGEATPEQTSVYLELSSEAWGKPLLTLDQYMELARIFSATELARNGGIRCWVLYKKSDPLQVVAGCETVRKTVFIRQPQTPDLVSTQGTKEVQEALSYGIAGVFTNPAYRRLGMANLLLRKLQGVMDSESAACSVLYSDIGKLYYANLGWDVFPHEEATLTLLQDEKKLEPESCCRVKTRWLARGEVKQLCELDMADLQHRLKTHREDGRTHVALAPTFAEIDHHFVREENFPQLNATIDHRGAVTTDGKSWITWVHSWKKQRLLVLRIVTASPESQAHRIEHIWALLSAAVVEASNTGLKAVVVWNPDEATTSGVKATSNAYENDVKVVFAEREGSIPSFRWLGGQSTAKTTWDDNEYYCWC